MNYELPRGVHIILCGVFLAEMETFLRKHLGRPAVSGAAAGARENDKGREGS
jgi:hypothetical protein